MQLARYVQSNTALGGTATIGIIGVWTNQEVDKFLPLYGAMSFP